MDEMLTTAEALKVLKVARSTLYRWIDEGKIQTYNLAGGKKVYFKRSELNALFQPNEIGPKEDPHATVEPVGV
jgi:excisionase family DNA binding protein